MLAFYQSIIDKYQGKLIDFTLSEKNNVFGQFDFWPVALIEENETLRQLHDDLHRELKQNQIHFNDTHKFSPHISLSICGIRVKPSLESLARVSKAIKFKAFIELSHKNRVNQFPVLHPEDCDQLQSNCENHFRLSELNAAIQTHIDKMKLQKNKQNKIAKLETLLVQVKKLKIEDPDQKIELINQHIAPLLDPKGDDFKALNKFNTWYGHAGAFFNQAKRKDEVTKTTTVLLLEELHLFLRNIPQQTMRYSL